MRLDELESPVAPGLRGGPALPSAKCLQATIPQDHVDPRIKWPRGVEPRQSEKRIHKRFLDCIGSIFMCAKHCQRVRERFRLISLHEHLKRSRVPRQALSDCL